VAEVGVEGAIARGPPPAAAVADAVALASMWGEAKCVLVVLLLWNLETSWRPPPLEEGDPG
jgi:hypothetical protein